MAGGQVADSDHALADFDPHTINLNAGLLTVPEAAQHRGVTPEYVRHLVRHGQLEPALEKRSAKLVTLRLFWADDVEHRRLRAERERTPPERSVLPAGGALRRDFLHHTLWLSRSALT